MYGGRAGDEIGLGQRRAGVTGVFDVGQAEVDDLGDLPAAALPGEEDVLRLEVAVDDAIDDRFTREPDHPHHTVRVVGGARRGPDDLAARREVINPFPVRSLAWIVAARIGACTAGA
jgi:hypothetical protein